MSSTAKLLVAALLLVSFSAFAQDSAQSATAPAKRNPMDRAEQRLKRLAKRLNLTDDQKEKLKPILQDEERQLQSLQDDGSLTPQQKRTRTRGIRMTSKAQMDDILTPEQKEKIQTGRAGSEGRHRMHPGKANSTNSDQSNPQ
ncbi:MAG: hypothetical protein WAQ52_11885 [Terriglobales bacterium]